MNMKNFFAKSKRTRTLIMSLVAAAIAFLFALLYSLLTSGLIMVIPATLAAAIAAALCWWFIIERPEKFTRTRYIMAGLLCGLLAHPFMWLMYSTVISLTVDPSEFATVGEFLTSVLQISFASLLIVGWATAGVGALGGWLFSIWANRASEFAAT